MMIGKQVIRWRARKHLLAGLAASSVLLGSLAAPAGASPPVAHHTAPILAATAPGLDDATTGAAVRFISGDHFAFNSNQPAAMTPAGTGLFVADYRAPIGGRIVAKWDFVVEND
jgi:hypothetical protein